MLQVAAYGSIWRNSPSSANLRKWGEIEGKRHRERDDGKGALQKNKGHGEAGKDIGAGGSPEGDGLSAPLWRFFGAVWLRWQDRDDG